MLTRHQTCDIVHPYTCINECNGLLEATKECLQCPKCDYKQYWAWDTSDVIDETNKILKRFNMEH